MNDQRTLRPWETALMLALCLALFTGVWADAQQARLAGQLVRLHVIAASDSETDQAEKLAVRDAVLAVLTPRLEGVTDSDEARRIILSSRRALLAAAHQATAQRVRIAFGTEHYPTRDYGAFALPAGDYASLRVILGAGAGRNWWCVVFPPLCAQEALSGGAAETLARNERDLITRADGEYEIRFRVLEIWDAIKQKIEAR